MNNTLKKRKTAVVTGAGGFIGHAMVKSLKQKGYWVRGVDIKKPEFSKTLADEFIILDLAEDKNETRKIFVDPFKTGQLNEIGVDEVYNFAAWMGGAGVIFTGDHDADIIRINASININVCDACKQLGVGRVLYTSSACCYNHLLQLESNNPGLKESMAWPAYPDSVYGKEKLFSEDIYLSYHRNYGLDVRIVRLHNIFGPESCFQNGKEKAPAAMCRKVLKSTNGEIEIWGDGNQTRSFLYIDECIKGLHKIMESSYVFPVNLGSDEMVSINQLVDMACSFENKKLTKRHIPGPLGVQGRNSDNALIKEVLDWAPNYPLIDGLRNTYFWIKEQIEKEKLQTTQQ